MLNPKRASLIDPSVLYLYTRMDKFNPHIPSHPKYSVTFRTYLLETRDFVKKIPNQVATETIKNRDY